MAVPILRVGVEHGKVELLLGRVEIDEQIVDLVEHFLRAGVGPIDLVDDDDRRSSRRSSALRSTNRVCGSGPSDASTSSITPSTIDSVRSTSPPKSAWPGVSTMLISRSL